MCEDTIADHQVSSRLIELRHAGFSLEGNVIES
jgi:hypothetical protein